MSRSLRRRLTAVLGLAGALLGVVAGVIQLVAGVGLPELTGAKLATVPLGLLTVGLAALAGWAARRQLRSTLSVLARAACALGLIGPGLLCLSTVGRLGYPPAVFLAAAGILAVDSWRQTGAALVAHWPRVLLSVLGGCQILMAASASPALLVVGALSGCALIVAAWWPTERRVIIAGLVVLGAVPFAVLGWTAVIPIVVAALAAWFTVLVLGEARHVG